MVSLLPGNLRRLSPHPSAGGAADTFSPRGRRLLSALKAFPEGLRPQARVGAQPPNGGLLAALDLEAAARRRLMRAEFA